MDTNPNKNKKLLAGVVAASTLGGAAAGAAFLAPGFAGAQDDTDSAPDSTDEALTDEGRVRPEFGERIAEALQPLVDDNTLTEAQVEAVIEALTDARPEGRSFGGPGHHRFRGGPGAGADIAGLLGLEPTEVREALQSGSSIADLADAQGVDVQSIIDAIVDAAEERVNGALEAERIDQEKADEILAGAEERAEAMVNGELDRPERPERPEGFEGRGFGPRFRGGPGFDGGAEDGTTEPALNA